MGRAMHAELAALVPALDDLPGAGWSAIDGTLVDVAGGESAAELFDCLGPTFPGDAETVGSATSAHFVRPPRQLVHGVGVRFERWARSAPERAASVLRSAEFAECLGRSVAADLGSRPDDAELLTVDVTDVPSGRRVTFTGVGPAGVVPVHLDIVVVESDGAVSLLWFADTPHPFPALDLAHVVDRLSARVG